jgi:uncharacterized membrane protein
MRVACRHALVALGFAMLAACEGEQRSPPPANPPVDSSSALADAAKDSALGVTDVLPAPSEIGAFHAVGTEPFWGVVISDSGLTFSTPESPDGIRFPASLPALEGKTYRWSSATVGPNAHRLEVTIVEKRCSDGMSDKVWTHAATVRYDGQLYEGCADRGLGPSRSTRPD